MPQRTANATSDESETVAKRQAATKANVGACSGWNAAVGRRLSLLDRLIPVPDG
jgi:hypothetical protein